MNEPSTVTYPTAELLKRIEDKLDSNQKETNEKFKDINTKLEKINTIEVKIATLTEKVEGIDKRLGRVENTQDTLVKEVSDLKGFPSLILPIIVGSISAVIGGIVTTVVRFFVYPIT